MNSMAIKERIILATITVSVLSRDEGQCVLFVTSATKLLKYTVYWQFQKITELLFIEKGNTDAYHDIRIKWTCYHANKEFQSKLDVYNFIIMGINYNPDMIILQFCTLLKIDVVGCNKNKIIYISLFCGSNANVETKIYFFPDHSIRPQIWREDGATQGIRSRGILLSPMVFE